MQGIIAYLMLVAAFGTGVGTAQQAAAVRTKDAPSAPIVGTDGTLDKNLPLPGRSIFEPGPAVLRPLSSLPIISAWNHEKIALFLQKSKIVENDRTASGPLGRLLEHVLAGSGQAGLEATKRYDRSPFQVLDAVQKVLKGVPVESLREMPSEELEGLARRIMDELQGMRPVGVEDFIVAAPENPNRPVLASIGVVRPVGLLRFHPNLSKRKSNGLRQSDREEPALLPAAEAPKRKLFDAAYNEIVLDERVRSQVPDAFYSFEQYMDKMLHHPQWGYYTSGRVRLGAEGDFGTYPISMSPYFARMIADKAFMMWQGMRRAGTLSDEDRFTVAEFGGGNGQMAFDFLSHVRERAKSEPSSDWSKFAVQVQYVIFERSPALREMQQSKNAEFGPAFRSQFGDARNPLSSIPESSVKGLVVSNELIDAFGAHKVIFSENGRAEAAFVVPAVSEEMIQGLEAEGAPQELLQHIEFNHRTLERRFGLNEPSVRYLDRESFEAMMKFLSGLHLPQEKYETYMKRIKFHETYVPVSVVPELAGHLKRNLAEYAYGLAQIEKDSLAYVNIDADNYIEGAARILKAGYVITIDYGDTTAKLFTQEMHKHFRTYGKEGPGFDPYDGKPSLHDMTTDQNFSALANRGRDFGLRTVHFGPQRDLTDYATLKGIVESLQWGTDIRKWVENFILGVGGPDFCDFKVLVQQKQGTDPEYVFSRTPAKAVNLRERAVQIRAQLLKQLIP